MFFSSLFSRGCPSYTVPDLSGPGLHRREYSSMANVDGFAGTCLGLERTLARIAWGAATTLALFLPVAPARIAAQGPPQGPARSPSQTTSPTVDAPSPQATQQIKQNLPQVKETSPPVKERFLIGKFPDKPSVPPTWSIPLDPLGFTPPGAIYLGARNTLASLDFIDENRLLFTFRIPGLLHRDAANSEGSEERQIRAVVLVLPQGAVQAEAQWTVHDRVRYLWMLKSGNFLFRDRNKLSEGDATLALKPLLDFPGSLVWLDMDPAQRYLVTNSFEPAGKPSKAGQVASPSTAAATATTDEESPATNEDSPDLVVRILRRDTADVMLVSRVRSAVHLPINSQGYLENLRGRATQWVLNLSYFTGGSRMLGNVESSCSPTDDFLSENEILVTGCGPMGESKLVAMATSGRSLWGTLAPPTEIWPQTSVAANGLRLAWETLDVNRAVNSYAPLGAEDIKEQSVTVFDTANGDIAMVSPVSPILDAGGNVAVSPSGRRVAILDAGAIQVFELPSPPQLPATPGAHSGK